MKIFLLFFALALAGSVSGQQYYYWVFPGEDAPNQDIQYMAGSIADLENACSSNPKCVGFNGDGWLKDATNDIEPSSTTLYLKSTLPPPSVDPFLVPMPQQVTEGNTAIGVPQTLQFITSQTSEDLSNAIARYKNLIFSHPTSTRSKTYPVNLPSIKIIVENIEVPLQMGINESYTISIPEDGTSGVITANTVYGVYHALETLSQLIVYNFFNHSYQITNAPVNIVDYPRFAHRGILVDSARHFQPVASLLSIIDSLTYAKMNILHWHIVDSQSFPFESISYPDLWDGSYTPMERYTQEDVAQVIEYGRQRGVRVMLEFDMPGHAASWCVGYPEVCPSATCTQPLNPATNATFDLVSSLLGEITGGKTGAGLVPENLLHLGGDEVDTSCWNSTASIVDWMNQNNFDADDAYMYFVNRAHQIAIDQGRIPVNWQEVFDHFGSKLDKRSIIHIWDNRQSLARVVAAGYRAILSDADVWYLDHLNIPWELFYTNEPYINITDPTQQQLIIGGEVCMWGETVDVSDVMETIWPRAAAAAERLWSDISVNQTAEFYPRLASFRCTLNNRGIAAAPTSNADARTNPPNPGSCYFQ